MGGGTPCKLMNGEPRVTRIMFICDKETPPVGMVSGCDIQLVVQIHVRHSSQLTELKLCCYGGPLHSQIQGLSKSQSFRVLRWLETSSLIHCLCVIVLLLLSTHPHFLLLPTSSPHPSHPLFLLFLLSSSTLRRSQPAGMRQWSPLDNSARTKLTGELLGLTNQITIFTMYM